MMSNKLFNKVADQYTDKIYGIAFFTAVLIILSLLIFRFLLIFTYNGEVGGIDNNFVYAVIRSMAGFDIYPDPEAFPYAVNPYSPLYVSLCSFIGKIFKINIEDPINIYRLCRVVSFTCDILTCVIFFQTIKKATRIKKELMLLLTAILACTLCYLGYTFSRADSLFLFFYALTLYVLISGNTIKNTSIFLLGLVTACIFSKQNGVILPLLVAIWLFKTDSLKKSLSYLAFFVLVFTVAVVLYKNVSGHPYFTSHVIQSLNNRIDLSWFYVYIFKRYADSLLLLPIYFGVCISFIYLRKGSIIEQTLGTIFLLQTLFSIGTSLKFGSTAGYFNESLLLSMIIISKYISTAGFHTQTSYSKKILPWLLPIIILFTIHVHTQGYLFFIQNQKEKKEVYTQQVVIKNYLEPKLGDNYLFNLGNQNGDFFKTLFYKQAVVPNYDAVNCCTLPDKTFDYSNLLNDLRSGKIGWLIMPENEITKEQWGVSLDKFVRDTSLYGQIIYKFQNQ
jgi:hypothetical protein